MSEQRAIDGNLLEEYIRKIDMPYETKTTVLCTINTMPAIDTVRHGKWYTAEAYNGYLYWNCDQCHNHFTSQKSNYCPNCGAKMDKE